MKKTMKLLDFINRNDECDVDVYSNYSDDFRDSNNVARDAAICHVCDDYNKIELTDEGKEMFGCILDLEVEYEKGDESATIIIPNGTAEIVHDKCFIMLYCLAGFCSETTYNKWFKEIPIKEHDEIPF